jgi:hypothetical protein
MDEHELLYVRDDVEAKLTDVVAEQIHRDLVLQGVSTDHLKDLFGNGELRCTAYRFTKTKV